MKAATSLDNRVAAKVGERTRISSDDSLRHAHAVRAEIDAIAVGSGTVLADDPLLTAREVHRRRPLTRVLFDRRLRIPPSARVFSTLDAGPVIIVTTPESLESNRDRAARSRAGGRRIRADKQWGAARRRSAGWAIGRSCRLFSKEGSPCRLRRGRLGWSTPSICTSRR